MRNAVMIKKWQEYIEAEIKILSEKIENANKLSNPPKELIIELCLEYLSIISIAKKLCSFIISFVL